MSLWNKIKLAWKGRSIAENAINIKSRWKEPTFWVAILGNIGSAVGYFKGVLDPRVALIISSVTGSLYNYVRGLEKSQTDGVKPFNNSSEFLVGLGSMVNGAMIAVQDQGINPAWLATTTVLLGHAVTAARDLANMRPQEAQNRATE